MYPTFRPGYYIKLINEATRYFRKIDFRTSGMSDLYKWFNGTLVKMYWKNDLSIN